MFGKSPNNKQRFRCKNCLKTFIWKQPYVKKLNEQHWFKLWIAESYSIRQISQLSGHSPSKLKRIKNYWLNQAPKENLRYRRYKYILFDGTYFHKSGCLMNLMSTRGHRIIANLYAKKESYPNTYPWFMDLKNKGLNPLSVTMDGHLKVIEAIKAVWPKAKLQRCLCHIQRQGLQWLRTYPKTEAGKALRILLRQVAGIKSFKERNAWLKAYKSWLSRYSDLVKSLPGSSVAFKDLKRTMALISNALPDMFHYLKEQRIPATTNSLENFYSQLKSDYQRHRGLSIEHRISYLRWFCYFKSINNF